MKYFLKELVSFKMLRAPSINLNLEIQVYLFNLFNFYYFVSEIIFFFIVQLFHKYLKIILHILSEAFLKIITPLVRILVLEYY